MSDSLKNPKCTGCNKLCNKVPVRSHKNETDNDARNFSDMLQQKLLFTFFCVENVDFLNIKKQAQY